MPFVPRHKTDPAIDEDSTLTLPDENYQNSTNKLDIKRAGRAVDTKVSIANYPYIVSVTLNLSTTEIRQTGVIISNTHVFTTKVPNGYTVSEQKLIV